MKLSIIIIVLIKLFSATICKSNHNDRKCINENMNNSNIYKENDRISEFIFNPNANFNLNKFSYNQINKNKMDKLSKDDIKKELEVMMFDKELIDISAYFCNSTDESVDMIARMMEDEKYKLEMKNLYNSGNNKIQGSFIDDLLKNKTNYNYKMVIVVRKDIGMSSGKMAAQVAHAAVNCYKYGLKKVPEMVYNWETAGAAKIVLMVNDLKEFNAIENKVKQINMNYAIIQDAGKTELEPGTITTIAIGPAPVNEIDKITGELSTYKD